MSKGLKVKCYGLYDGDKEIACCFANPSQKEFLDYELKGALKRLKRGQKIEFENGANGVWYCRIHPDFRTHTQLLLLSKESSTVTVASSFFNQVAQIQKSCELPREKQKLRIRINDLIKVFNSNEKVEKLNTSVMELEGIVKGNISKLTTNMTQLDSAQRKSEMMNELSMQFERDARALQKKMKKRKLMMKLLAAGIVSVILAIVIYILFF